MGMKGKGGQFHLSFFLFWKFVTSNSVQKRLLTEVLGLKNMIHFVKLKKD